jgi:hypothetical protein
LSPVVDSQCSLWFLFIQSLTAFLATPIPFKLTAQEVFTWSNRSFDNNLLTFALLYAIALVCGSVQCSAQVYDVRDLITHAALTFTQRLDRVLQVENNWMGFGD